MSVPLVSSQAEAPVTPIIATCTPLVLKRDDDRGVRAAATAFERPPDGRPVRAFVVQERLEVARFAIVRPASLSSLIHIRRRHVISKYLCSFFLSSAPLPLLMLSLSSPKRPVYVEPTPSLSSTLSRHSTGRGSTMGLKWSPSV